MSGLIITSLNIFFVGSSAWTKATGMRPFFILFPTQSPLVTISWDQPQFLAFSVYSAWIGKQLTSAGILPVFFFNYVASAYVLTKLNIKPLAVAAGAFFFTFGLPLLFQENHPQLLYRIGIPLSCYFLWQFSEKPDLKLLSGIILSATWQIYLGMYNGIFLAFLLVVLTAIIPVWKTHIPIKKRLLFWPAQFHEAWQRATTKNRYMAIFILMGTICGLIALFLPYYQITKTYGFARPWSEIATMLPQWRSYLLADGSQIWGLFSSLISGVPVRYEHQLFPGLAVVIILLSGIIWRPKTNQWKIAWIHLLALIILIGFTFYIHKQSLYWIIWQMPGMNSIRSITRIILVLMWPIAVFAAYGLDALLRVQSRLTRIIQISSIFMVTFLFAESVFVNHVSFIKKDAQYRAAYLRDQIPVQLPNDPILIFGSKNDINWYAYELDAMLAAQDMGLPIFNGYSGNRPTSYGATTSCISLPKRILSYMDFAHITNEAFYLDLMKRTMPVGFDDCNDSWWERQPTVSKYAGSFPDSIFKGIQVKIVSAEIIGKIFRVKVEISNQSEINLPAISTTKNFFVLSWRLLDSNDNHPVSEFNTKIPLDFDLHNDEKSSVTFNVDSPDDSGSYRVEVAAAQEGIAWFDERGGKNSISDFTIIVDGQKNLTISLK